MRTQRYCQKDNSIPGKNKTFDTGQSCPLLLLEAATANSFIINNNTIMTWTRLHDACQHHDDKMILKLAHSFAEEAVMVDDHGSTPLHIACWGGNHAQPIEVLQALLRACPQATTDQDVVGNTPLHVATSHPDTRPEIVRALLEACPIASSIKNKEGLLPLHMACRYAPKNELVIAVLVDAYPFALRSRTKVRPK
jgi:ankyrin repeat protein